ncbi:MAG: DUF2225 domain-containing protein [Spirochaetota bacterium]|nr:DUF2225 domain-containing protein [Spirochaetota bacterium]
MQGKAGDSITFFSKENMACPVCGREFQREDLRTGRGRMFAGSLTDELRRLYEPTEKFGEVYPPVYSIIVCPECLYAAFPQDFGTISGPVIGRLKEDTERRRQSLDDVFPELNFEVPRTLKSGIASYHYAIQSMQHFPREYTPSVKSGISALRAAWLCNDLHRKYPGENFDYLARIYYHKAWFFYTEALKREEDGTERIAEVKHLGPDTDQNYGYDGVLYIAAWLEFHHGPREDEQVRAASLERAKTMVGRLFGLGKASKEKPSTLLERARGLYSEINVELKGPA